MKSWFFVQHVATAGVRKQDRKEDWMLRLLRKCFLSYGLTSYHQSYFQLGLIVRDFHHNLWFQHSWQTIANPPILWRLPILLSPVFQILPNPLPHYFCCLVSLTKCVITPHLTCYFALWYYGPKLGTLVQATPCFVLYTIRHQIYCRFDTDDMSFASTLIW